MAASGGTCWPRKRAAWLVVALVAAVSGCAGSSGASQGASPTQSEGTESSSTTAVVDGLELPLRVAGDELGLGDAPAYGRGVSLVDIDGDGWDDLWTADTDARLRGDEFGRSRAYRNVEGTFEPWDLGIDDDDVYQNGGGFFGDYTGDGAPDLFLVNGNNTGPSTLALYENDLAGSGRFVAATAEAGITDAEDYWWGATWIDVDQDDLLDLVVTGSEVLLYRNLGDGSFEEVAAARGMEVSEGAEGPGNLHNPVALDIEGDGDQDVFVASLSGSHLFRNEGGGRFVDATEEAFGPDFSGPSTWAWIADVADLNQDGIDDLWLGRWYYRTDVMIGRGDGTFERHGADLGVEMATVAEDPDSIDRADAYEGLLEEGPDAAENTMGLLLSDLDGNGYPDAVIGTGAPAMATPPIVWCGFGGGPVGVTYRRCSEPLSTAVGDSRGHGVATGDIDHDGTTDVVMAPGGFPPFDVATTQDSREEPVVLLGTGSGERSAHLRLLPSAAGAPVLGTVVAVEVGEQTRHFTIRSARGFQNQVSETLLVDVGEGATASVRWPDGTVSEQELEPGRRVDLRRPS